MKTTSQKQATLHVRTRLAPSPTGFIHVGTLRQALYNVLLARQHGGRFILRIEDTDQSRSVDGAVENLLEALAWADLMPDEGVIECITPPSPPSKRGGSDRTDTECIMNEKGEYGPYVQSKRLDIYQKYAMQLLEQGSAYRCFCSSERLAELRTRQQAMKQVPRYDKTCRVLSRDEQESRAGEPHVIRLAVPEEGSTVVEDIVHGTVTVPNADIDDQVLMKSDGFPTYHLASVVDDHLMHISHVIRGTEWLPSAPKHVLLYNAFGWEQPIFVHTSLMVNPNKSKLSKRHGHASVDTYRQQGYLPEALVNFLALLGWNPGTEQELFDRAALIEQFSLERIHHAPATFTFEKLDWMNAQYIRNLDAEALAQRAFPFLPEACHAYNVEYRVAALATVRERVKKMDELPQLTHFYWQRPAYEPTLLVWKKSDAATTKERLTALHDFLGTVNPWDEQAMEAKTLVWIKENEWGNGDVLWPMRVALSGEKNSPGPFEIAAVLGKEESLARVEASIKIL